MHAYSYAIPSGLSSIARMQGIIAEMYIEPTTG